MSEWIPFREARPQPYTLVLTLSSNNVVRVLEMNEDLGWFSGDDHGIYDPLFWAPMPTFPRGPYGAVQPGAHVLVDNESDGQWAVGVYDSYQVTDNGTWHFILGDRRPYRNVRRVDADKAQAARLAMTELFDSIAG
jgi:hypothetical protein